MATSMVAGTVGIPEDPAANEQKILNAGRIPYHSFRDAIAVLFTVAALTFIVRIATRLYTRRRIFLDDAFLVFSFVCLTAGTILLYKFVRLLYTNEAIKLEPTAVVNPDDLVAVADSLAFIDAFLALIWTSIFFVKFSFLALFRLLLKQMPKKIVIYFWVVVGFCGVTWLFLISEPFILCPYFGFESIRCTPEPPYALALGLTVLVSILDITSDIMIVSIPIIILRRTQMKAWQQFRLAIFLCLSIVVALVALTRISAYRLHGVLDLTWQIFWMWTEAGIAMMMGSMAAFRALLLLRNGSRPSDEKKQRPVNTYHARLLRKMKGSDEDTLWRDSSDPEIRLQIPSATLTGFTSFFRTSHTFGTTTGSSTVTKFGAEPMLPCHCDDKLSRSKTCNEIQVEDRVEVSDAGQRSRIATSHHTNHAIEEAGGFF